MLKIEMAQILGCFRSNCGIFWGSFWQIANHFWGKPPRIHQPRQIRTRGVVLLGSECQVFLL